MGTKRHRCAAVIGGKPCTRKPKFRHEDRFGDTPNSVGGWFVTHTYWLCRWCSAHRESLQSKIDNGCAIIGGSHG